MLNLFFLFYTEGVHFVCGLRNLKDFVNLWKTTSDY